MRYSKNSLVTRTGKDIHLVIDIDDDCYYGQFKCLYDSSGIYKINEIEGNMGGRYDLITEKEYPELFKIMETMDL